MVFYWLDCHPIHCSAYRLPAIVVCHRIQWANNVRQPIRSSVISSKINGSSCPILCDPRIADILFTIETKRYSLLFTESHIVPLMSSAWHPVQCPDSQTNNVQRLASKIQTILNRTAGTHWRNTGRKETRDNNRCPGSSKD